MLPFVFPEWDLLSLAEVSPTSAVWEPFVLPLCHPQGVGLVWDLLSPSPEGSLRDLST